MMVDSTPHRPSARPIRHRSVHAACRDVMMPSSNISKIPN
jgi:hypothetical protein